MFMSRLTCRRSSAGKDQTSAQHPRMTPIQDVSREVTLNKTPVLPAIGALQFGTPPQPQLGKYKCHIALNLKLVHFLNKLTGEYVNQMFITRNSEVV